MSTKRVILWSAPRCVSTAFERSVRNLANSKVFHQPFMRPYFSSPERQSTLAGDQPANAQITYESVCAMLQKDYSGMELVFSKELAHYLCNKFDRLFLQEGLKDFQHTFLIRHPRKTLTSLYRVSVTPELTGQEYADPEYAGFKELFEMFRFVQLNLDASPVVVDAEDLLDNPEGIMKSYCEAVGVQYQENMTRWSPGPITDFDCIFSGWHDDVMMSSGITRQKSQAHAAKGDIPKEWERAIEKCTPFYEAMRELKIHALGVCN